MENLYIAPTEQSPEINFAYSEHRLYLGGESYPENALAFYAPVRASLERYLAAPASDTLNVHFSLRYFNSSSTKLIRSLMLLLNAAAEQGRHIVTRWYHDPEDDMMQEFGMDMRDEFRMVEVQVLPT